MALRWSPAGRDSRELPSGYLLSPRALALLVESPDAAANPIDGVRGVRRPRPRAIRRRLPAVPRRPRRAAGLQSPHARAARGRRAPAPLLDDSRGPGPRHRPPVGGGPAQHAARPAIIGPGARLTDAYVGPYSSIGANVTIEGAEIEHSIVLPGAALAFVGTRIESSVIGEGARIARAFRKPSSLRMSIGNGAEVLLS